MYLIMFLFFPILRRLSFIFIFKSADTMAMLYASMAHPFSTPSLN